jgi:hypothetical protein
MKNIKIKIPAAIMISIFLFAGCSKLDEKLQDRLTLKQVEAATAGTTPDVSALLTESYKTLLNFNGGGDVNIPEHVSDLWLAPTRGGDWDDNGAWRALYQHTWDADHANLRDYFNRLNSGLFSAIDLLQFSPTPQQEAEARYIRAFYVFWICDGWGQVPMRTPGAPLADIPSVMSSKDAINFVISELKAILPNLPDNVPAWQASKAAANALLAKAYINKAVFESTDRKTFTFSGEDMTATITYCDAIINSGKYTLESNYFNNFTSDNLTNSKELIFSTHNIAGIQSGSMRGTWMSGLHYNQTPSGWNGFTTLAELYNSFDATDTRRGMELPALKATYGLRAGLLYGQQYDKNGVALKDRQGNPLFFTLESPIIVSGAALEVSGVRVMKFIPPAANEDNPGNQFPFFRYGDILLTKAEALMRSGNNGAALTIVNQLRTVRGAGALASIDETSLLAERARELYCEGWRRTDLIRFGKFLDPWNQKTTTDDPKYLLFPFPSAQIVANPSLKQNPGY